MINMFAFYRRATFSCGKLPFPGGGAWCLHSVLRAEAEWGTVLIIFGHFCTSQWRSLFFSSSSSASPSYTICFSSALKDPVNLSYLSSLTVTGLQ